MYACMHACLHVPLVAASISPALLMLLVAGLLLLRWEMCPCREVGKKIGRIVVIYAKRVTSSVE